MDTQRSRIPPHIFWPGLVVALLCVSLTAATITVVAAVSDSSFAVEEDYYAKGLAWDEHMDQQRRNEALGWTAEIGGAGPGTLEVSLRDREGRPIEGAVVEAVYFHHTAKAAAAAATLAPTESPGVYAAPADLGRAGRWSVSLVVTAAGETFTSEQKLRLEGP